MDISRIQYLCEFKIKANTIEDTVEFPSFDQYLGGEVVSEEKPLNNVNPPAPQSPNNSQPQEPVQNQQPVTPPPAPAPSPEPIQQPVQDDKPEEEAALMGIESQIKKTDEILQKLELLNNKINSLEHSNSQTIEKIKNELNPSLDKQVEKVASKSSPFSINVDDYFKSETAPEPIQQKLEITNDDIENYSDDEIKDSFNN